MVVEDDHTNGQYRQQPPHSQPTTASHTSPAVTQVRPPPHMIQGRTPYLNYPQSSYYTSGAARDPYMDYGYGYNTPADPSLYPSPASINNTSPASIYSAVSSQGLHPPTSAAQQSGVYFDYSGSARSPSQFYYPPHQAMVYAAIPSLSPIPTPQLSAAVPAGMPDKKQVRVYVSSFYFYSFRGLVRFTSTGQRSKSYPSPVVKFPFPRHTLLQWTMVHSFPLCFTMVRYTVMRV